MSVIFIALPIALLIALSAVFAFVYAVREGQYDDLETPPRRILFDDIPVRGDSVKSQIAKNLNSSSLSTASSLSAIPLIGSKANSDTCEKAN